MMRSGEARSGRVTARANGVDTRTASSARPRLRHLAGPGMNSSRNGLTLNDLRQDRGPALVTGWPDSAHCGTLYTRIRGAVVAASDFELRERCRCSQRVPP